MKIGINARILSDDILEGIGNYAYQVSRRLISNNPSIEWILYSPSLEGKITNFKDSAAIQKVSSSLGTNHIAQELWMQTAVNNRIKKDDIDLFISFGEECPLGARMPTIVTLHDVAYLRYPEFIKSRWLWHRRLITPRAVKKANEIVTVSHFSKSEITHFFPEAENKISISYSGLKRIYLDVDHEGPRSPDFVIIGSVNPRKRVDLGLRAFELFWQENPESKLYIIGELGWQNKELKKLYEDSPARDHIIWTGYITDQQIAERLSTSVGLLFLTDYEGFGIPTLEAMATKTRSLSQKKGAMEEIGSGYTDFVSDNIHDIASKMEAIKNSPSLDPDQEKNRMEKLLFYTWDRTASVYQDLIEKYS